MQQNLDLKHGVFCSGSGMLSDTASPQTTWTAGMTKGVPPKELIAELERNRSAPISPEDQDEAGVTPGSHPLDVLYGEKKAKENSLAKSSSGLDTKASAGLMSKPSGADFDTLSSNQVLFCLDLQ